MQVRQMLVVMKTDDRTGLHVPAGVLEKEVDVVDLRVNAQPVLDTEDGNYWVLAAEKPAQLLKPEALTELSQGEGRRAAMAKLSDEDVVLLGLVER